MCKPTAVRLHTHLLRHTPDVQSDTHTPRPLEALAYFRHNAHVCSGLSMYTCAQSHRGTYIYMSSDSQNSTSMLSSQVHTCSDLQLLTDVLELQMGVCMFRTATYIMCSDLPRYRCTRAQRCGNTGKCTSVPRLTEVYVSQVHPTIHLCSDLQSPAHMFTFTKTHTHLRCPQVPTCVLVPTEAYLCAHKMHLFAETHEVMCAHSQ